MNIKPVYSLCIVLAGVFLSAIPARATSNFIDHEVIRTAVQQYLQEKTRELDYQDASIEVGRLDNRLNLPVCGSDLEVIFGNNRLPGNVTVAVKCNTGKSWKIYLQASVNAYRSIYAAQAPIARGTELTASDLKLEKRNITTLNGNYLTDLKHIKGHIAKRSIRMGEIIKPSLLIKTKLIKRGEQVTIIAETEGISIRSRGKALNDASAGGQVRVENNNSKRIIEGTAINRGVVKINM